MNWTLSVQALCLHGCVCVPLRDAASRRELLSVIAQLADSQPDILVTSLLHCLLNSGVISKNGEPRYCFELFFFLIYKVCGCTT